MASEQAWEAKAQATPDPQRVRNTIQKLSDKPHLAGTPASKAVAEYLAGQLHEWGLDTHIEEFEALLPTPQHRVLEMTEPKSFRAKLVEPGDSRRPEFGGCRTGPALQRVLRKWRCHGAAGLRQFRCSGGLRLSGQARHQRQRQDRDRALRRKLARREAESCL